MAFNGTGTASLTPTSVAPAVSNTTISSTDFNATMADIVSMLNKALCRDGQANPTANLPMATYRHTGVGNAQAANEYAAAGQVQAGTMTYAATSVGTDAYAITVTPAISAYSAGMRFQALIDVANTGACTLNVNSVGAVAIKTQDGADPATNTILATSVIDVIHDGTNFVLLSPAGGSMAGVTLVSPTLTSPVLNGTLSGTAFLDDDTMAANSAVATVSQQSLVAYVNTLFTGTTGSFTPFLSDTSFSDAEGQTYSFRMGLYRKIGSVVYVYMQISMSSLGTLTGSSRAHVGGTLPFPCTTEVGECLQMRSVSGFALPAAGQSVAVYINGANNAFYMQKWSATTGTSDLLISEVTASGSFVIEGFYLTT